MARRMYRGWINQPSTLQPLHHLHGTRCLVQEREGAPEHVTLWFVDGPVISMEALRLWISKGE